MRRHYSGADEHHKQTVKQSSKQSGKQSSKQSRKRRSKQTIAVHRCKTTIRERMTCGR